MTSSLDAMVCGPCHPSWRRLSLGAALSRSRHSLWPLEDAVVLGRCFVQRRPTGLAAAFLAYQGLRLDRTAEVVEIRSSNAADLAQQGLAGPEPRGGCIKTQWSPRSIRGAARLDLPVRRDHRAASLTLQRAGVRGGTVIRGKKAWDDVIPLEERETTTR